MTARDHSDARATSALGGSSDGPGRVLIVEDDLSMRRYLCTLLHTAGYRTLALDNCAEARAVLEDPAAGVMCVLLDEHLPDGRGIDLVELVRKRAHSETTPVLVLTGHDSPIDEVAGLEAGATDYLVKPVDGEALLARIATRLRDQATWVTMVRTAALHGDIDRQRFEATYDQVTEVIASRAFRPVYQPILCLDDGGIVGYEALTRFADGTPPDQVFSMAADVGLGTELELATLDAALEACSSLPSGFLSLNVTPSLLAARPDDLRRVIDDIDREIVLEITEREAIDDYEAVRSAVSRLPSVQLSIDDAGAGFSSLRHVVQLRPEYVKLDRSWVDHIDGEPTLQAMVAGLVHFAGTAGCHLIAEGIETANERDILIDLGVELGQGYLLGRPAPASI